MAYVYRGRRTAYDNIAVGEATGVERHIGQSTSDLTAVSDPSLYNTDAVSPYYGDIRETGGFTNIAVGETPGVEDTDNNSADKITSGGEDVAN